MFKISDATKGGVKKSVQPKTKKKEEKSSSDLSKLDDNAKEVAVKFKKGCECHDQNCFEGILSSDQRRGKRPLALQARFLSQKFPILLQLYECSIWWQEANADSGIVAVRSTLTMISTENFNSSAAHSN